MAKLRGGEMTGYLYAISTGTLLLAGACITIAKSVDYKVMIRTIMDFEGKKKFPKRNSHNHAARYRSKRMLHTGHLVSHRQMLNDIDASKA